MVEQVNQKVDVLSISKKGRGIISPIRMKWQNKLYTIKKIGLQHPVYEGKILVHVFDCTDGNLHFRLRHNTQTLQWTLEATDDGLPT